MDKTRRVDERVKPFSCPEPGCRSLPGMERPSGSPIHFTRGPSPGALPGTRLPCLHLPKVWFGKSGCCLRTSSKPGVALEAAIAGCSQAPLTHLCNRKTNPSPSSGGCREGPYVNVLKSQKEPWRTSGHSHFTVEKPRPGRPRDLRQSLTGYWRI